MTLVGTSGSSICILENCKQKHRGTNLKLTKSYIFIKRDNQRAFSKPKLSARLLSPEVLSEYMSLLFPLDEWRDIFESLVWIDVTEVVTSKDASEYWRVNEKVKNFKTPRKDNLKKAILSVLFGDQYIPELILKSKYTIS